jgi:hypothetical protein
VLLLLLAGAMRRPPQGRYACIQGKRIEPGLVTFGGGTALRARRVGPVAGGVVDGAALTRAPTPSSSGRSQLQAGHEQGHEQGVGLMQRQRISNQHG